MIDYIKKGDLTQFIYGNMLSQFDHIISFNLKIMLQFLSQNKTLKKYLITKNIYYFTYLKISELK